LIQIDSGLAYATIIVGVVTFVAAVVVGMAISLVALFRSAARGRVGRHH
jgi:MFS superfamily sulfate permease-like transporter